jgi:hypothetical protein
MNPSSGGFDPAIVGVRFAAYVHGPTNSARAQSSIFAALALSPVTQPTHGSLDDRRRPPIDPGLAARAGAQAGAVSLWRLTAPRYTARVDATTYPIGRVTLHYTEVIPQGIPTIGAALEALVGALQPEYAILHFDWRDPSAEQLDSGRGFSTKEIHYCKYGPPGVFAWTWFGPALLEQLGFARLLAQGATLTAWRGASLPLLEPPWSAGFEALRARQIAVDAALRPCGAFGAYFGAVPTKGEHWTPRSATQVSGP